MADNEGTTTPAGQAQGDPGTGSGDEVTLLKSRNAGLDAKVTSLTAATQAATKERDEAFAKLAAYEAGKVGADEALRAQLAAKDTELATERKATALARIEAKYPETFSLMGDAAFGISEEALAANEARLKGVAETAEDPGTPERHNGTTTRPSTGKPEKEITGDDAVAQLMAMKLPDNWGM